jgi:hypothetical protein
MQWLAPKVEVVIEVSEPVAMPAVEVSDPVDTPAVEVSDPVDTPAPADLRGQTPPPPSYKPPTVQEQRAQAGYLARGPRESSREPRFREPQFGHESDDESVTYNLAGPGRSIGANKMEWVPAASDASRSRTFLEPEVAQTAARTRGWGEDLDAQWKTAERMMMQPDEARKEVLIRQRATQLEERTAQDLMYFGVPIKPDFFF